MASVAGVLGQRSVGGEGVVMLCRYDGPDVREGIRLINFTIYGPKDLRVGDYVVVFFNLEYVGSEDTIMFDRIYVSASLPDGGLREYEDKSFVGMVVRPGDVVRFHIEIYIDAKGVWTFWPSFQYQSSSGTADSKDPWHECKVVVQEAPTTTTTTQAIPDLAFDPQYTQPMVYTPCDGFYAHIANIGTAPTPDGITAMFLITSLATGPRGRWLSEAGLRAPGGGGFGDSY